VIKVYQKTELFTYLGSQSILLPITFGQKYNITTLRKKHRGKMKHILYVDNLRPISTLTFKERSSLN